MTDQLTEIKRDLERGGDAATWPAAAVRWLVGEVERLHIYEGFGQDHGHERCVAEIQRLQGYENRYHRLIAYVPVDEWFRFLHGERPRREREVP